jgi:hypothetical protein
VTAGGFALGTPLLFDGGVYLAVAGSVLALLDPYLERDAPMRFRGPEAPGAVEE